LDRILRVHRMEYTKQRTARLSDAIKSGATPREGAPESPVPPLPPPSSPPLDPDLRERLRGPVPDSQPEKELEKAPDDVRTLAVDYDGQGERHKAWRQVTLELTEEVFSDWPPLGPRTTISLAKHMERHGRTPTGWIERWAREKHLETTDRAYHEMKCLGEILEQAGSYDQLNLGSLSCMELLVRRMQIIIDAYSRNAARPNFDNAEHFSGLGSAMEGVSVELRAYAARKAKQEAEIEQARQKARDLRGTGGGGAGSGDGAADDGGHAGGGRGRGRGRGRG